MEQIITRLNTISDAEQFCKQLDDAVNCVSQITGVDTFLWRDDAVKVGQFNDMFDSEYELIY